MGMFDYVDVDVNCPNCGTKIEEFQTKDTDCTLAKVDVIEVDNFYGDCEKCGTWVEFDRKIERKPGLEQFEMQYETKAQQEVLRRKIMDVTRGFFCSLQKHNPDSPILGLWKDTEDKSKCPERTKSK